MPLTSAIQDLVTSNHLSQVQAENLSFDTSCALQNAEVRQLIVNGTLTIQQILELL